MFTRNDFNSLVKFLRNNGYNIRVKEEFGWDQKHELTGLFAKAENSQKVTFGFVWKKSQDDEERFYAYIENAIAADNSACFDKWSKCPMRISLPQKHEDILKWLKILASDQSYELSNSYSKIPGIPFDFKYKQEN